MRALAAALVLASAMAHAGEPRLLDVAGHEVSFAALHKQITVISFWATYCAPCLAELPSLQALSDALGPSVAVLAVSIDPEPRHAEVAQIAADKKLTLPVLQDVDRALLSRYFPKMVASGRVSVPQLLVLDPRDRGYVTSGFDPDEPPAQFAARLSRVVTRLRSGSDRLPSGAWRHYAR